MFALSDLSLIIVLCYDLFYYIHFTDNKTEVLKDEVTCPKSHSKSVANCKWEPGFSDSTSGNFPLPHSAPGISQRVML